MAFTCDVAFHTPKSNITINRYRNLIKYQKSIEKTDGYNIKSKRSY
ncbi:hypothetical protein SDC9_45761 [bioreactor metagenome]|uniref:Uncharacterized protein n=1 Tax=bioreactor metagenome TaxID=1076179 RepID=A0A644WAV5_9ZZZZ